MGVSDSLAAALKRQLLTNFPNVTSPKAVDVAASEMNPLVARFLEAILEKHVSDELNRISYDPSEWIPIEKRPEIDEAIRQSRGVIAGAVAFPASRWEYFVGLACEHVCRYLVSPTDSLLAYVFPGDSEAIPSGTARKRIRSFGSYNSILGQITAALPADPDQLVEREAFQGALDIIAQKVGESITEWDAFTEPLFALHEEVNGSRTVPADRLVLLAASLHREDVATRIEDCTRDLPFDDVTERMLVGLMVEPAVPEELEESQPDLFATRDRFEDETAVRDFSTPGLVGVRNMGWNTHERVDAPADDATVEDMFAEEVDDVADAPSFESETTRDPVEIDALADSSIEAVELDETDEDDLNERRVERPYDANRDSIRSENLTAQPRRSASDPAGAGPVPLWKQFHKKLNAPMTPVTSGRVSDPGTSRNSATAEAASVAKRIADESTRHEKPMPASSSITSPASSSPPASSPASSQTPPNVSTPTTASTTPTDRDANLSPDLVDRSASIANAPASNRVGNRAEKIAEKITAQNGGAATVSRAASIQAERASQPVAKVAPSEESVKPLWLRYQTKQNQASDPGAPQPTAPKLTDLERLVLGRTDLERRHRFVSELFDASEKAYSDVLAELGAAKNWSAASTIIADKVFRRYRINIYSDVAVTFTNAVEQRFL